jgi:type II secretory pathway component PulK
MPDADQRDQYELVELHPAMNLCAAQLSGISSPARRSGSVLIIVLWIAFGLVAITLYFAHSTSFELRAADNRVCGLAAEQAIEAGARYAAYILATEATNGILPDPTIYAHEAVPVGEAHFWYIGRHYESQVPLRDPYFALVDESSKFNLTMATTNTLDLLPRMTVDLENNIIQWRMTNGGGSEIYAALHPPYSCKNTNFETVDELRLVYGANMDILVGEDANRNGVLDADEFDDNHNNEADPGLLEYFTVYSREPNTRPDGSALLNLSTLSSSSTATGATGGAPTGGGSTGGGSTKPPTGASGGSSSGTSGTKVVVSTASSALVSLISTNLSSGRAATVLASLGSGPFASPLAFFLRSGMTSDEFALVANNVTASSGDYVPGRVNVNSASPVVLACLPGMTPDLALQLVNYRQNNPYLITNSIAWVVDALGQNNQSALQSLAAGDYITIRSYQFAADIAALGPYGRGYRRVRFIFDLSSGTPQIVYRQDLTHLGWALGRQVRQNWLLTKRTR